VAWHQQTTAHGLPRSMEAALEKMQHSAFARQVFGNDL
jgi:glutamine synthetase